MSEIKTLDNVHVVIYSRKMLNRAIDLLKREGQKIADDIVSDYYGGRFILQYYRHEKEFDIYASPFRDSIEITLNELIEMVISNVEPKEKVNVGDWLLVELTKHPEFGFSIQYIVEQHSADSYNKKDCTYFTKKISPKEVDRIRKELE